MSEVYISIDIEADGPIPGENSMLSLGAASFILDPSTEKGYRQLAGFGINLQPLPEATPNPETIAWWHTQPEAYKAATENAVPASQAMQSFREWLAKQPPRPVLVGYPVTYDFMWVYWYYVKFVGFPTPFGFQGMDIKTLALACRGGDFRDSVKKVYPRRWFKDSPRHSHKAVDDAIGQGILCMNILKDLAEMRLPPDRTGL